MSVWIKIILPVLISVQTVSDKDNQQTTKVASSKERDKVLLCSWFAAQHYNGSNVVEKGKSDININTRCLLSRELNCLNIKMVF